MLEGVFPHWCHFVGMETPLLTATEVAELLKVPRSWVYARSREGSIPTVALGRYRRYRREAIDRWLSDVEGQAAVRTQARRGIASPSGRA